MTDTKVMKPVPLQPKQDRLLGMQNVDRAGRSVTPYDPKRALTILDWIAEGYTLNEICTVENGMPHKGTFRRWCYLHPDLAKAYREATQVSATALEEEALDLAREIKRNPGTGVDVRAGEVALGQFRWSASRRDPSKYGDKGTVSISVPIQINTGLNLGDGANASAKAPNIYEINASVQTPIDEVVIPEEEIKLIPQSKRYDPKAKRKRVLIPGKDRDK